MKWIEQLLTLTRFILGVLMLSAAGLILYHLALWVAPPAFSMIRLVRVIAALCLGVCGTLLLDGRGRR